MRRKLRVERREVVGRQVVDVEHADRPAQQLDLRAERAQRRRPALARLDILSEQSVRSLGDAEPRGWLPTSAIISRLSSPPSHQTLSTSLLGLYGEGLIEQRQTGGGNWRYEYRIAHETQEKRGLRG